MRALVFLVLIVLGMNSVKAETITENIAQSKKWSAYLLTGHSAWGTEACIASSLLPQGIVEVYGESLKGIYTEPSVQILFSGVGPVFSAEVSTNSGQKWKFNLATAPIDANLQAVIARLADRSAVIDRIKKDNTLTVDLRDAKNKSLKTLSFSLSGSSKVIDEQFKKCDLKFAEI